MEFEFNHDNLELTIKAESLADRLAIGALAQTLCRIEVTPIEMEQLHLLLKKRMGLRGRRREATIEPQSKMASQSEDQPAIPPDSRG